MVDTKNSSIVGCKQLHDSIFQNSAPWPLHQCMGPSKFHKFSSNSNILISIIPQSQLKNFELIPTAIRIAHEVLLTQLSSHLEQQYQRHTKHLMKRSAGFSIPLLCFNFKKKTPLSSALATNAILSQYVANVAAHLWISQITMRSSNLSPIKLYLLLAHRSHGVRKKDGESISQMQYFRDTQIANHRALLHMNSDSKLVAAGSVTLPKIFQRRQLHR